MIRTLILSSIFAFAAACGGSDKPEPQPSGGEPAPGDEPPTSQEGPECGAPADGEALTPEQCACMGGEVRGDIGDGQIACAPTEQDLGNVMTGIEGGKCCKPQAAP